MVLVDVLPIPKPFLGSTPTRRQVTKATSPWWHASSQCKPDFNGCCWIGLFLFMLVVERTNPPEKYARQNGNHFPPNVGGVHKNNMWNHHLGLFLLFCPSPQLPGSWTEWLFLWCFVWWPFSRVSFCDLHLGCSKGLALQIYPFSKYCAMLEMIAQTKSNPKNIYIYTPKCSHTLSAP